MTDNALVTLDDRTVLQLVSEGDCSKLTEAQRLAYYRARCQAAGLDERTAPFQFLKLNGKLTLYAKKEATDQLSGNHGIVCEVVSQTTEHDIRVVTVRARTKDGRQTDEIGAVPIKGLQGEQLANALMKALTKAKRRACLSLCGLGMMDESELEGVKDAKPVPEMLTLRPVVTEPAAEVMPDFPAPTREPGDEPQEHVPACPEHGPGTWSEPAQGWVCLVNHCTFYVTIINDKQRRQLWAAVKSNGKSENELRDHLRTTYGWTSTKQITLDVMPALLAWAAGTEA